MGCLCCLCVESMAWQHRWAGGPFFLLTNGRGVGPAAGATGAWSAPRLPSATPHCDSACGCAQFLVSEMRAHKNALTPSFDAGQEACSQSPRIRLLELLYSVLVWFPHCCALAPLSPFKPCPPSLPSLACGGDSHWPCLRPTATPADPRSSAPKSSPPTAFPCYERHSTSTNGKA